MTLTVPVNEIVARNSNGLLGKRESWRRVRLGDVATIQNGAAFKSEYFNQEGRGLPLLRIRDVMRDHTDAFYDGPYEDRMIVEPGDLVVGMDGDFNSALWSGPRALLNQRVCRVIFQNDLLEKEFAFLVLQGYLDAVNEVTSSITVKHLSSRTVAELPLPVPPRDEQEQLLRRLRLLFHDLAEGEGACDEIESRLTAFRASVLQRLFEVGGPEIPIDAVGEVFVGATPPRDDVQNWGGGIPWVSSGEVAFCRIRRTRETISEAGLGNRERRLHPPGTVLLAMIGEGKTRGQAAILDLAAAHNQNSAAIRLDAEKMIPEFLYYCLMARYESNRRRGSGSQQPALNGGLVREICVPCPDLGAQRHLVRLTESSLSMLEGVERDIERMRQESARLRRSVLSAALAGRLIPPAPEVPS